MDKQRKSTKHCHGDASRRHPSRFLCECTSEQHGGGEKESGTCTVLQTGQQQRYQSSEHHIIIIFFSKLNSLTYNIAQLYIILLHSHHDWDFLSASCPFL